MPEKFDVAVLGAGLFGSALAYHLARDYSQRVLVVDAQRDPERPSGTMASAGILSYQGWDDWDLAIVRESLDEYGRISDEEGTAPLGRNGGIRVARTEEGTRWLGRVHRVLERTGIEAPLVGAGALRDLLPFAELGDVRSALFTPGDATVDPVALRDAYLRRATRAGVRREEVSLGTVPEARPEGGWILSGEAAILAESLVVAAGPWSKPILASLGHPIRVAPFRAQVVRLRPHPLVGPYPTVHDLDLNLYLRPDSFGRLVAGDGTGHREEDPFHWEPTADPSFVDRVVSDVGDLVGALPPRSVEAAWAGLCVASPDRYPLVGRVSGAGELYVATGFNGFGTMRAGGLARRLARAIRSKDWRELQPADPGRLPSSSDPFDPRPEFPLEGEELAPDWGSSAAQSVPEPSLHDDASIGVQYRLVTDATEVAALAWTPLSEWFDPFLPGFARDALRTGGTVEIAEGEGRVRGLLLLGPSEGVGSGFTRTRAIAERYLGQAPPSGLYLEQPWQAGGGLVEVFAAELQDWEPTERLRNRVRIALPDDLPRVRELMRAELGAGVDPWFASLPRSEETAFVGESDGRIVGVSWLTRVGPFARGHSFVVHPRFRGLGMGTDLLTARMLWLRRTGGRRVVSEIYDGNRASRTAAERAGMALVGRMYHLRPPKTD
jgi:sarcosine oxidase, subunit beta